MTLPDSCDLLVIGSGAGALSAAVTAAHLGLKVVVVEKTPVFGGTSAWSGGWMWIPRNPLAVAAGIVEDDDAPREYLRALVGAAADEPRMRAFLAHGPAMVQFHLDHTALRFVDGNAIPDFHGRAAGARTGGRSVCAAPFDASVLGPHLKELRPPLDVGSFLGMSIGGDLRHFLRANRAPDSAWYVTKRIVRHAGEVLRHGQGTWRFAGNALVAALLKSALDRGVRLIPSQTVLRLTKDGDRVTGAVLAAPGGEHTIHASRGEHTIHASRGEHTIHASRGEHTIHASRGVVVATGGFPHDVQRKAQLFPHAPTGREHWSAAPPTNTGDGLRLAEAAGAVVDSSLADAGAWAPVSLVPRANGSQRALPHLVERGKPGLIAVDAAGERFVDEAGNYHSFMRALFARCAAHRPGQPVQAWLIVDHRFQRRFGLGFSKPWPFPLGGLIRSGYLQRGATVEELAQRCSIDATGLARTVHQFNEHARRGDDPAFGRGSIAYDRMQGDAEHDGPNPCVAPIERGPFYAVKIVPGSLGTFAGVAVNEHAQALDAHGAPIPGLYVNGNDMASVMGGHYPSGGITLGPAMTFGYVLAHHATGQPLSTSS